MQIPADILGAILEPGDKPDKLLYRFLVSLFPLFRSGKLRVTQNPGIRIAAGPGNRGRWSRSEKVDPVEGTLLRVKTDGPALDQILADIIAIKI